MVGVGDGVMMIEWWWCSDSDGVMVMMVTETARWWLSDGDEVMVIE